MFIGRCQERFRPWTLAYLQWLKEQVRQNLRTFGSRHSTKFIDSLLRVRVSAGSLSLIPTPVLGEAEGD